MDPGSALFLLGESRDTPMHVGMLQLYEPPEDAGPGYARAVYEKGIGAGELAPLFAKRPVRGVSSAGQWSWMADDRVDLEYHVRLSALPRPGRPRDLLELVGRLHGQQLSLARPPWEYTIIEGLDDGRIAVYSKMHHSLVDGVSAMRLVQRALSTDSDQRDLPPVWAARRDHASVASPASPRAIPLHVVRSALGLSAEAAGLPAALIRTLTGVVGRQTAPFALDAPRTILNTPITGARRIAAQSWELERLGRIGQATGSTLNDVVLGMCAGALRSYLLEIGALPDSSLIAMVPVALKTRATASAADGGNAVGSLMVRLGTNIADPATRMTQIRESMRQGKDALAAMSPMQILAMSAIGFAPTMLLPLLGLQGALGHYNLAISNVPGPRETLYMDGARMTSAYPLSIPMHNLGMNITCSSYDGEMAFGLVGCRRTVPHLQRLLGHLEEGLAELEVAAGV
jgi:diacylglycerol O-acyltransferase